jgi:hypothetical protein
MARAYIQGRYAQASVVLINELRAQGIASTVGYDTDRRTRNNTLIAYVAAENAFRVPREWRGFKVTVHVDKDTVTNR